MAHELITAGAIVAAIAWAITMQVRRRSVTVRRLVALPLALVALALGTDHGWAERLASPTAVAFFGAGLLLAAAMGLARARTMRVWHDGTAWVSQGSWRTVVAWIATFAVRIATAIVAARYGAAEGSGEIMCFVAVTLAAQNVALAWRAGMLTPRPELSRT